MVDFQATKSRAGEEARGTHPRVPGVFATRALPIRLPSTSLIEGRQRVADVTPVAEISRSATLPSMPQVIRMNCLSKRTLNGYTSSVRGHGTAGRPQRPGVSSDRCGTSRLAANATPPQGSPAAGLSGTGEDAARALCCGCGPTSDHGPSGRAGSDGPDRRVPHESWSSPTMSWPPTWIADRLGLEVNDADEIPGLEMTRTDRIEGATYQWELAELLWHERANRTGRPSSLRFTLARLHRDSAAPGEPPVRSGVASVRSARPSMRDE